MVRTYGQKLGPYAAAITQLNNEYEDAISRGLYKPLSPLAFLNVSILISGLYIALICSRKRSLLVRFTFFIATLSASIWSATRYRSPGVVGSLGVGLNALMMSVFAANFLILRDPRDVKHAVLNDSTQEPYSDSQGTAKHFEQMWTFESPPSSRWHRFCWIFDLLACLRALKWSWKSSPLAEQQSPPINIKLRTLKHHLVGFACSYVGLDIIKCIMIADPHFLGNPGCLGPPHWAHLSPLILHTYRMLLPAIGITCSIQFYCSIWAIFQMKILGLELLGINGQEFMFPPLYGSLQAVCMDGLRGFWGRTWHQIFRQHFLSIGDAISAALIKTRTAGTRNSARSAVRILVVFALSGMFHASGSYTMLGTTKPFNAFVFFALQPVGIAVQTALLQVVFAADFRDANIGMVHKNVNAAFTISWLWATFWLLADDFSRGGMWLFEPIPVSFVRGLRLSAKDSRWLPYFNSPVPR